MKPRKVSYADRDGLHHEAWFHGWTKNENGEMVAVIETFSGAVNYVEPYRLTFLDHPEASR